MIQVPEQFQFPKDFRQTTWLVNGELREWHGAYADVSSPVSRTDAYSRTHLGQTPVLGEKEALEALDAAVNAYDRGQGEWPTMKVA
ncbi:MAG: NADP-dependent glyceraldehyde-3-phosphate dehydrogenase, partial [Chitinophagaceae bacterium]